MMRNVQDGPGGGMRTSPWIILGSTGILLIVVMVLAFQNTHRERRYMSTLLRAKGAVLIRAVEAGARTGMMGMMWGGLEIQRLLEETARLPDVLYMAVIDQNGVAVAHSDPARIDAPFDRGREIPHTGSPAQENWGPATTSDSQRVFEVHRDFRPLVFDGKRHSGHRQGMMQRHRGRMQPPDDWFSRQAEIPLRIVVGLDVTPFEAAIRSDIRTTVLLSVLMILLGFGGFVSLFWMQSYRAAKQSLKDTSAFADEIVRHLPVGLIATDRSKRITFFNTAAESMTGLHRKTVHGRHLDDILPADLDDVQKSLDGGGTVTELEMECRFSPKKTIPVSVSAAPIAADSGEFIGQVFILRDLGEIRGLQNEIRRQEKLAALGGLAAGVAHEIRNPLSSIKGLATFFADQFSEGSDARQAADVMVQEVDRLNRAITELLEFARPSDLKKESTDIGSLLERAIQLIRQDATNQSVDIELDTPGDICRACVDPDRLAQCLLNLFLNGIQAMKDGGTLAVGCRAGSADTIDISISDSGQGIEPTHLGKIFDPYYTTKKAGTGLGLAIVYKIIETHKGQVSVKSTPGLGTTFTVTLPIGGETNTNT